MQVWVTAIARAPIVGGVSVARMASRRASFHRRTGFGARPSGSPSLLAATGLSGRVQAVRTTPARTRRMSMARLSAA